MWHEKEGIIVRVNLWGAHVAVTVVALRPRLCNDAEGDSDGVVNGKASV